MGLESGRTIGNKTCFRAWQDVKSSTVMKHPELYRETMNTRRQDFTANLTRSLQFLMLDTFAIALVLSMCGCMLMITTAPCQICCTGFCNLSAADALNVSASKLCAMSHGMQHTTLASNIL